MKRRAERKPRRNYFYKIEHVQIFRMPSFKSAGSRVPDVRTPKETAQTTTSTFGSGALVSLGLDVKEGRVRTPTERACL